MTAATHCRYGHLWTPESTYLKPPQSRQCRRCWAERRTRERNERKAEPPPPTLDTKAFARLVDAIRDGVPERDLAGRFDINHDTYLIAARAAKRAP